VAFATVKYAGAAYLCFLGIRMIADARRNGDSLPADTVVQARNPFWQGIATEVLNPKTALFFLSFIPQFVNRGNGHVFWQFLMLGTISVTLNTSADLVVTMFGEVSSDSADGYGRDHDRAGDLSGGQQGGVGRGAFYRLSVTGSSC
jgi:threonine/homoserine/homoserine lactone efflux protein